jgi:hypothetical protein
MRHKQVLPILLFIIFISPLVNFAQTSDCDCSAVLHESLMNRISSSEYRKFKDWLSIYYQKNEESRLEMKRSSSFSGSFSAVIESLPLGIDIDRRRSGRDLSYYHAEEYYMQNRYISDEILNELFVVEFGVNQLEAYKACLDRCGIKMASGLKAYPGGDLTDILFIKVTFDSPIGGQSITLRGNASFVNLEPIGVFIFTDSLEIRDRQTLTQYFKRIDPYKPAQFSFNVREPIGGLSPLVLEAQKSFNSDGTPIGTIIASILDYNSFMKVNNFEVTGDMSTDMWVPCDGRELRVGKYANVSGGKVPDLRGVFLRGINDFGVNFPTVRSVAPIQRNPENKRAGEFQNDEFKKHSHKLQKGGKGLNLNTNFASPGNENIDPSYTTTNDPGGPETRPKNVTVYYYIKIN